MRAREVDLLTVSEARTDSSVESRKRYRHDHHNQYDRLRCVKFARMRYGFTRLALWEMCFLTPCLRYHNPCREFSRSMVDLSRDLTYPRAGQKQLSLTYMNFTST